MNDIVNQALAYANEYHRRYGRALLKVIIPVDGLVERRLACVDLMTVPATVTWRPAEEGR